MLDFRDYEDAIVDLLPKELKKYFEFGGDNNKYFKKCKTNAEVLKWENDLFKEICSISKVFQTGYYNGDRAFCPLCDRGSTAPYDEGFALPNGLEKHLRGSGAYECSVFKVLRGITWEYFKAIEDKETNLNKEIHAERMATEILLKFSIFEDPEFLKIESTYSYKSYRNEEELKLSEKRLKQLGFKKTTKDRIRSYIFKNDEYFVYADPRELNKIVFYAYKKPLPKKVPSQSRTSNEYSFYMLDSWKHDLKEKFLKHLKKGF
ncbi:MAG: hypothetical protein ACJ0DG_11290 [bacterium]